MLYLMVYMVWPRGSNLGSSFQNLISPIPEFVCRLLSLLAISPHFACSKWFPLCVRALVLTVVVSALRHYEDDLAHEDVADVVGPKAITGAFKP